MKRHIGFLTTVIALTLALAPRAFAADAPPPSPPLPPLDKAAWIWSAGEDSLCHCRKTFTLAEAPVAATLLITADNGYELFVNGSLVGSDIGVDAAVWKSVERYDLASLLSVGKNVIAIRATDLGGQSGLLAAVRVEFTERPPLEFASDKSWRVTVNTDPTGFAQADFAEDAEWKEATVRGANGVEPWGKVVFPGPTSPNHGGPAAKAGFAQPGENFAWPAAIIFLRGRVPESSTKDAQQAIWRINHSRAYLELDIIGPALPGRALYALVPARPDGEVKLLWDAGKGLIGSPSVSFDGTEIFFSHVPAGEKFWRIYRMPAAGGAPQPITRGPFHDFDPEPLPDGRIVFSSTRAGSREEYHGNPGRTLFVMNADGSGIRPLTHHIVGDNEPKVTAAGHIAFIRQDNFMERAKVETHVHVVRPDGSGGHVLLGPNRPALALDRPAAAEGDGRWLRSFGFGSIAPLPDGRVAAISSYGVVISGHQAQPPVSVRPALGVVDLSPLPDGRLLCTTAGMSGIGILDPGSGETFKLHTKPPFDLHSPVFLGPRPRPPVVRELIDAESEDAADATGFLIAQNVFYTRQTNAALARVRAVRVMEGRPFTLRSARHQYDHLGVEAIELGTVPLAPDGSFHVEVPADRALALQAVDAEGRSVVNELSWIYVRPGERRACVGCHSPREGAPPNTRGVLALRAEPVRLLGQGRPLRFRGNNAANGGVLNLQFDRFREVAAIDLHDQPAARNGDAARKGAITPEVPALLELLRTGEAALKISSAQRLAVFRHRAAAAGLAAALRDESALVRLNAALALAACGTRESVPPLLAALDDADGVAAQAADLALRNLSGHTVEFNAFAPSADRERGAARWRAWFKTNDWPVIERALIARLRAGDAATTEDAINALGHVGGDAARDALRDLVARDFGENLRVNLAALRALGHLQDPRANELLVRVLNENIPPRAEKSRGLHEYGWIQAPVHRAGAAAEALGRIGTAQAEAALVEAFTRLEYFTNYTYRSGDHEWLVGCHASIPHFRLAAALDALGTRVPPELVPTLLRSVPIDTDRALLFENDSYEAVTGRLVNRSGVAAQVIENCLSALGDEQAKASPELRDAVTNSPPAKSVGPLDPPARAAQLLAVVGAAAECAPRVRAALDRFRAQPPSRARSWTCFYLARALGRWRDAGSVDSLLAVLEQDPTEASFGLTDPPNVFLNHAMTPCHRAAAAYALGEIGERRATGPLLAAVSNFDNAMDVRHAAARALGRLADAKCLPALRQLAVEYPETATRRVLLAACAALAPPEKTEGRLARKKEGH